MILETLLLAVCAVFGMYRYLRWFAVMQQKEYRLDRLMSYVKTSDGLNEVLKFFPKKQELHPNALKRPKITARVLLLAVLVAVFHAVCILLLESSQLRIGFIVFSILSAPLVILVANVPVFWGVHLTERAMLFLASLKIRNYNPQIIGITGSYGKTTTKQLLAWVLSSEFSVWTTSGSVNTPLGIALSVLKNYKGEEIVILEYGAYKKGEIKKLVSYFSPKQVILTALNEQHAALFGSIEGTATAKAELLSQLPQTGTVFVFNKSADAIVQAAEKKYHRVFQIKNLSDFDLHINNSLLPLYDQTVEGVAYVVISLFSFSQKQLEKRIQAFVPTERWIRSIKKDGITIIDDGITSNPTGFLAALDILDSTEKEFSILITNGIVDLGSASSKIHSKIAQKASKIVDEVWCRSAEFSEYFSKQKCHVVSDEEEMLRKLDSLREGTVILIEGAIAPRIRKKLYASS